MTRENNRAHHQGYEAGLRGRPFFPPWPDTDPRALAWMLGFRSGTHMRRGLMSGLKDRKQQGKDQGDDS